MTKEITIKVLESIREYLCAGNPVWDTDMVEETMDVAISDVMSVRHGRWKCKEVPCVYGKKFILTCSECGESVSVTELALPEEHYCRSCGARMEGVEYE